MKKRIDIQKVGKAGLLYFDPICCTVSEMKNILLRI